MKRFLLAIAVLTAWAGSAAADEAKITVHADRPGHRLSPYLTGACIEDVNHEIYGGLYSQMIFGESFQEPVSSSPVQGFTAYGGTWSLKDGELWAGAGEGPKLVSNLPAFADGEVSVEVFFPDRKPGNAGLIVRVEKPGPGADNFAGYEISLDPAAQILRLGRHRHNWEHIKDTPCAVPIGQWIPLVVRLSGRKLEVFVQGKSVIAHEDGRTALLSGTIGLRPWQRDAGYRDLWVKTGPETRSLAFCRSAEDDQQISGMWRLMRTGTAAGRCSLQRERPFVGSQSQRIRRESGEGDFGLENQGLNRWGMHFAGAKLYEGILWARAEEPAEVFVALESADGRRMLAEKRLKVPAGDWQRLEFTLTPAASETKGRFAVKMKRPGSVTLGYAFLQPGDWGRFKDLPVRRDVAEALVDQGITVLRYGGSMVNCPEYRWKKMIGPRDRRPPYRGTWYPQSTNGWGIVDFLDFCGAAGFLGIPAFCMDETPQDMIDFVEYVNGPAESPWGRRRAADGHPEPYRLRHIELGNEERVDEKYFEKFKALAEAIWAKDPEMILVVGDFVYGQPIRDPFHFTGSAAGLTSLAGQQQILKLAKQHNREVWFDLHVGTDGPTPDSTFQGMFSFVDALAKLAEGARHKVAVFEFNAGNHAHRRALANALAIQAIERDGRIPIATSANCLQPDGQNDNGWDQGLLFLNPSQVWLQAPGHVTRMIARNYQPLHVPAEVTGSGSLHANAKRSEDGKTLVLQVVNPGDKEVAAVLDVRGFSPSKSTPTVAEELAAPLDAVNTADNPCRVVPKQSVWRLDSSDGPLHRSFPPRSFTVVRFSGAPR